MSVGVSNPEQLAIAARLRELVLQVCRGLDRGDEALVGECFHPHAEIPAIEAGHGFSQHVVTNVLVLDLTEDTALAESYWQHRRAGPDGDLAQAFGRYVDRFERRAGKWRIAERQTTTEWSSANYGDAGDEGAKAGRHDVHVDGVVA